MPASLTLLVRLLVLAILALHVFYMYCLARTFENGFGFSPAVTIIASLFSFAMLVPLVWAVTLPELPEIYARTVRARRWWRQGRCPRCGYTLGSDRIEACPECGAAAAPPAAYRLTFAVVRRYVVINLLAWVLGCGVGELWLLADEHHFTREAEAALAARPTEPRYARARRWPAERHTLTFSRGEGPRGR